MAETLDKRDARRACAGRGARRRGLAWLLVAVLAAATSCRTAVRRVEAPVSLPPAFSAAGEAPLPEQWWRAFGDERLDGLIERALAGNFGLRTAWDRLDQARAVAREAGADLRPAVDGSAGVSREVTKVAGADRQYATGYSLGLAAGYEVDLWGRLRAADDAARLDALATAEDLRAAAVSLSAEVATTWYGLVEQRGQLALLDAQLETNRHYLDIITLQFRRGQVSATNVLQQRQLVESVQGGRALAASDLRVLEHQLAVLLGVAPGELEIPADGGLPALPPLPRTGLPAELLRRRPDVRAAEVQAQAADRRVAVAIANRFPALRLSAAAGTSAEEIGALFESWVAGIAADLAAPLFDAGLRKAEVARTRAVLSESLNSYAGTVLASLQEVEDALVREAKQGEYVASLGKQLALSQKSTEQTLENYTKGAMDFTRYLTTLLNYQGLQRTHLQARLNHVLYRVGLYRALSGAWPLERPAGAEVPGAGEARTPEEQ